MQSTYQSELWLPRPVATVFEFFSDARNLQTLTPDWLNFSVLSPEPIVLKPGALIDYRLRLHGFPIKWQTEITVWDPPHRFVDQQRRGPYRLWIHEHRFEPRNGGTQTSDLVTYAVPGGRWLDRLFVRRDVERIFAFRRQKLLAIFGS